MTEIPISNSVVLRDYNGKPKHVRTLPDDPATGAQLIEVQKLLVQVRGALNAIKDKMAATPATVAGQTEVVAALSAMGTKIDALGGYVDGLEALTTALGGLSEDLAALATTGNASLATIAGHVDGLEGLIAATTAAISTVAGHTDGLEALIGATNSAIATISGYTDGLEALIGATNTALTAATPAGENHVGEVGSPITLVDVTLTLDINAYGSGDVLADTQVVSNAVRVTDGEAILHSVTVIDKSDQGVALTLFFFDANVSLGTENSAPDIDDTEVLSFLCKVDIAAADYHDLGANRVAELSGLSKIVKAASGTRHIYVAARNGTGAPTFAADGIKLRLGFLPR